MNQRADVLMDAPALMIHPERVLLHALVRALRPRRVLEIGTHQGGSTLIICAALDEVGEGVIVCVDPNPLVEPHDWERVQQRASMIVGLSPDALRQAAEVAGGAFDFVLIDGDHTSDGVRRDIDGLLPLLATNSYIVLHDSHYWQVKAAIDDSLTAFSDVLVDCGTLSREEVHEGRVESGYPVVWGGLRLLRYIGPPAISAVGTSGAAVEHAIPVDRPHPMRRIRRLVSAPLKRYLDSRFDQIERRLDLLVPAIASEPTDALARVDVSAHNAGGSPPTFDKVVSQVVSAAQFLHPDFDRVRRVMFPGSVTIQWGNLPTTVTVPHRKLWEFVYVLRAAEQHAQLEPGRRAVGFGVGQEPIPASLARFGLSILATDLESGEQESAVWAATGQHMSDLRALSKPDVVSDDVLAQHVSTRYVDMNAVPDDLGRFDLIWSCCALEHLGSPEAGLDFILRTLDLLEPGGVSVHTTELELTPREETADHGHLAVYRKEDLDRLAVRVRDLGFEIETNWYVSMDTPADRWIALPPYSHDDPAHLKLAIGDSVSTSVGLLIRRPV